MRPEPGQLIASKYRLERPLARGGMGSLWVARHTELEVDVALKFSRVDEDFDSTSEQRFKREAQAAAQLKSPHIVQIHDYGLQEGVPYIAMELLTGEDLGEHLDRVGRVSLRRALAWLCQAAKGLRVVHRAGVVHRDIKPSNLFLAEHGGEAVLKVLDFGIAKTPRESGLTTSTGVVLGSPAYMSPEQARGNAVDERSDLWSLAAVFYRMITGSAPFEGSSSGDILVRVCTEDVAAPSSLVPRLDAPVDAFFRRALVRDPSRRFPSVDELMAAANELSPIGSEEEMAETDRAFSAPTGAAQGRSTPTASIRLPVEAGAGVAQEPELDADSAPGAVSERLPAVETTQESVRQENGRRLRARALWVASGALALLVGVLSFAREPRSVEKEPSGAVHEVAASSSLGTPATPVPPLGVSRDRELAGEASRRGAELDGPADDVETTASPELRHEARTAASPPVRARPSTATAVPTSQEHPKSPGAPEQPGSATRADPVFGLPVSDP